MGPEIEGQCLRHVCRPPPGRQFESSMPRFGNRSESLSSDHALKRTYVDAHPAPLGPAKAPPAARLHRSVSADALAEGAGWGRMAARAEARRLPHRRAEGRRPGPAVEPEQSIDVLSDLPVET